MSDISADKPTSRRGSWLLTSLAALIGIPQRSCGRKRRNILRGWERQLGETRIELCCIRENSHSWRTCIVHCRGRNQSAGYEQNQRPDEFKRWIPFVRTWTRPCSFKIDAKVSQLPGRTNALSFVRELAQTKTTIDSGAWPYQGNPCA